MAETLTGVPSPVRVYGNMIRKWTKVLASSEVSYAGGSAKAVAEHDSVGVKNAALFIKFAGYTGVNVHLEKSYDGATWVDVPNGALTDTGTALVVQPVAPFLRVHVTATLSAGADSIEVWLYEEYGNLA